MKTFTFSLALLLSSAVVLGMLLQQGETFYETRDAAGRSRVRVKLGSRLVLSLPALRRAWQLKDPGRGLLRFVGVGTLGKMLGVSKSRTATGRQEFTFYAVNIGTCVIRFISEETSVSRSGASGRIYEVTVVVEGRGRLVKGRSTGSGSNNLLGVRKTVFVKPVVKKLEKKSVKKLVLRAGKKNVARKQVQRTVRRSGKGKQ